MLALRLSPGLQLKCKKQEAGSSARRTRQCPPGRGYHQGGKLQEKTVIAKEEEREASKENRGREARSRKRRQLERDRVGMGAFSRGGCECEKPSKKQRVRQPSICGYMPEATKRVSKSLYDEKSVSSKHEGVSYRSSTPHSELFESQNSALLSRAQGWHQASHTADAQ